MSRGKKNSRTKKDTPALLIENKKGRSEKLPLPAKGRGFTLDRRGNLTLVHPHNKTHWDDSERLFRSLMYNRDGTPVSVGLPKFSSSFRDGARAEDLDFTLQNNETVDLSRKYDGTLIIRSVIRDAAYFRTRNALDAEGYDIPVRKVAIESYPILLDPMFSPSLSLHFEFISPKTRVVLEYPKDDLILIGGIFNKTLRLLTAAELDVIASQNNLRRAEHWSASEIGTSVANIQTYVNQDQDHEGLVARWDGDQKLLRFKSFTYICNHRRRFELNPERIFSAIERKGQDLEAVKRYLGLKVDDPLNEYVNQSFTVFGQLQAQTEVELAKLEELFSQNSNLTRTRLWQDVGSKLEEPWGAALMHIKTKEQNKAQGLLSQALRKKAISKLNC